eukprot:2563926-Prymnesium_polylepis.1
MPPARSCPYHSLLKFSDAAQHEVLCASTKDRTAVHTRAAHGHWLRGQLEQASATSGHYDCTHLRRYTQSLAYISPVLCDARDGFAVLELSDKSQLARGIEHFFPRITLSTTAFDLRRPFPLPDSALAFDLVLHNEILEHLKDSEQPGMSVHEIATFQASGIRTNLKECYRVLRPDGMLFLSTPNLNTYRSIHNLLTMKHAFAFAPHPRELSFGDVGEFVRRAGFALVRHTAVESWRYGQMNLTRMAALQQFMVANRYTLQHREDDTFVLAKRALR